MAHGTRQIIATITDTVHNCLLADLIIITLLSFLLAINIAFAHKVCLCLFTCTVSFGRAIPPKHANKRQIAILIIYIAPFACWGYCLNDQIMINLLADRRRSSALPFCVVYLLIDISFLSSQMTVTKSNIQAQARTKRTS